MTIIKFQAQCKVCRTLFFSDHPPQSDNDVSCEVDYAQSIHDYKHLLVDHEV